MHALGPLLVLLLFGAACSAEPTLSDAEKRRRIAAMYREYRESFPEVPGLTVEELAALDREDFVLVDAREPAERRVSKIPGAVTREDFESDPPARAGRRVVTYCTVGYRSGLYAAELRRRGFDAYNLAGSILAWTHAGRPLVDAGGDETRKLHVYGPKWDLAAEGYETVW